VSDEDLREEDLREPAPNAESRTLAAIVDEAKDHLEPSLSDDRMKGIEDGLFARIAAEAEKKPAAPAHDLESARAKRSGRALTYGAIALAAAAAFVLVNRKEDVGPTPTAPVVAQNDSGPASSLSATEGSGEVRVGGVVVSAGHLLRNGDVLETDRARAVLTRPQKVAWLLEHDDARVARARVKAAAETLVLGLEDGAIEAQVTPVPRGEAFAVDVAAGEKAVRVAVHGTHLRVARAGTKVVVDLNEGVVAIGVPPASGLTSGVEVHAPAHVELDVTDLEGTLKITRTPSAVRPAIPLSPNGPVVTAQKDPPSTHDPKPSTAPAVAMKPAPIPRPTDLPPAPLKPDPTVPAVAPREAIATAIKDCVKKHARSSDVRVTITSSLRLKVTKTGDVETAQFDPPLLPDVQTCAAPAIYKAKLESASDASTVTIPIEVSY
jgi:hypothetical protein